MTWSDVARTTCIYAVASVAHHVFRERLIGASFGHGKGGAVWDFLFYAVFGVIITSSLSMAGVLQVFAYLIAPLSHQHALLQQYPGRLLFGWGSLKRCPPVV